MQRDIQCFKCREKGYIVVNSPKNTEALQKPEKSYGRKTNKYKPI